MDVASRVEQVIKTAEANLCKGMILEPRFFFDEIEVESGSNASNFIARSTDGVFKNGEDYPIRISRMAAAIRYLNATDASPTSDERLIQGIGLRLGLHGTDYMSREFAPLPLWHSRPNAMSYAVAFGLSSYKFDAPWVLSARDTMKVDVQLDLISQTTREVAVAFTGYGLQTQRPYYKAGRLTLGSTVKGTISPDSFRNDGDEPICITDMTVHCSAEASAVDAQGDVRVCRLNVQQVGNGTNAAWASGPGGGVELMPGSLFGLTAGRAVVHEFPRPLIWEPGEGLHAEVQATVDGLVQGPNAVLALGFAGTIAVI